MRVRLLFMVAVSMAVWLSQWLLYERELFPNPVHSELYRSAELISCCGLLAFLSRRQPLLRQEWGATTGLCLLALAHGGALLTISPDCVVPFTLTLEWGQMVIAFAALLSFWPTLVLLGVTWLVGFLCTSIRAKWDTDFSDHVVLAGIYGVVLASIRGFDGLRKREFQGRYELGLAHRALQVAERARSRLFVNLSHDFRTPLALIHGEAALLQRQSPQGSGHAGLERIRLNAAALAELSNQLLELARLEAGRAPVAPLNFDVAPLLRGLCAQFAGKAATLELELNASEAYGTFADPGHVKRIVSNLIENGARAARGRVTVHCSLLDSRLVLDVSDDGPGVPEERRLAIFERFTSFDSAGSVASGIGLPVARELSELNQGRLWLVEEAQETTFRVVLPLAQGPLEALPEHIALGSEATALPSSAPAEEQPGLSPGGGRARTLLVVEDHPDMRRLLHSLLSEHFQVQLVGCVAGARRALAEATPDAILCDILLPDGDGFDVLSQLRAQPHFDGVPLLFVSALATTEQRMRGLAAGVDDYVTKPFEAVELVARVQLACDRAEQRRRALDAQRREFLGELHDGVTASLSRAALLLGAAESTGAAPAVLKAASEAVHEGLTEARTVLSLTSAGTAPWVATVERLELQLGAAEQFGLRLVFRTHNDGSVALLSAVEVHALERAARELLTNTIKHAGASTVRASVSAHGGEVQLVFADDGTGAEAPSARSGLAILERRITRLSGSVNRARAGTGTQVTVRFPLSLARASIPAAVTAQSFAPAASAALQ